MCAGLRGSRPQGTGAESYFQLPMKKSPSRGGAQGVTWFCFHCSGGGLLARLTKSSTSSARGATMHASSVHITAVASPLSDWPLVHWTSPETMPKPDRPSPAHKRRMRVTRLVFMLRPYQSKPAHHPRYKASFLQSVCLPGIHTMR